MRGLHGEVHAILVHKLQLGIYQLVGTVVVDENFGLFKVGSGGKWGVTFFGHLDFMLNSIFARVMKFRSGDDAHRAF
jgi:hypothetical protein